MRQLMPVVVEYIELPFSFLQRESFMAAMHEAHNSSNAKFVRRLHLWMNFVRVLIVYPDCGFICVGRTGRLVEASHHDGNSGS